MILVNFPGSKPKFMKRLVQVMMEKESASQTGAHGDNHGRDIVTIYVNDVSVAIHRGNQTVAEIKVAGNVPSTDILYLMPNYEIALNDNDKLTIKGGEQFKSCAPSGGSS